MEDFRDIVGFLIIGIGIVLSVLKERKDKKSSDNSSAEPKTPIQRRPQNQYTPQHPQQGPQPQQPITRVARPEVEPAQAITLPFMVSSVAERARKQQVHQSNQTPSARTSVNSSDTSASSTANAYQDLPEEGARVTKDVAPMDPISDYNSQEEEQFIEKLREGIILSEILQRKF